MTGWLTGVVALASCTAIITASSCFLLFIEWDLVDYFTDHNLLDELRTKVRVCVASLALSIACSGLTQFATLWTLRDDGQHLSELLRWYRHNQSRDAQCVRGACESIVYLCGVFTVVFAIIAAINTWQWWHILETLGEAELAARCRALTIYNIVLACLGLSSPLFVFILGLAGLTGVD